MSNLKTKLMGILKKITDLLNLLVRSLGILLALFLAVIFLNTVNASTVNANDKTDTWVNTINEQPFSLKTFNALKHKHLGQQWAVILWSVDCPACFKELALVNKLRQEQPDLAIVFINTDENAIGVEASAERSRIMTNYGMGGLPHLYFTNNQASKSRYQIDPHWYGELPRTYFIDRKGIFHGKSGFTQEALIRKWLMTNIQ
jgi:hypothetical protein